MTANLVEVASAATAMPQLLVAVPDGVPLESTTWVVKLKFPEIAGVRLMAPALFNVNPGGNAPAVKENV